MNEVICLINMHVIQCKTLKRRPHPISVLNTFRLVSVVQRGCQSIIKAGKGSAGLYLGPARGGASATCSFNDGIIGFPSSASSSSLEFIYLGELMRRLQSWQHGVELFQKRIEFIDFFLNQQPSVTLMFVTEHANTKLSAKLDMFRHIEITHRFLQFIISGILLSI